jgi:hypothetical protein
MKAIQKSTASGSEASTRSFKTGWTARGQSQFYKPKCVTYEDRLVFLVYLVCLVELDQSDEQNKPEEPDQPVPSVSLGYPAR